jgi:hypothetical protein
MTWANRHGIPIRMMDLPAAISWELHRIGLQTAADAPEAGENEPVAPGEEPEFVAPPARPRDPISWFADIAGYPSSDRWWEHQFEQKFIPESAAEHFEAVSLMMRTLRESGVESVLDLENEYREAYMAQLIRKARNEMYQNIVVVCGAWHAPALENLDQTEKQHAKILKKLPKSKIKVGTTWIPWTNDRLAFESGYGAGIASPGWYGHLWNHPKDTGMLWLTHVAHLFRRKKMDISTAHVIEGYRLAESLAALRELYRPGLTELNEATTTVMCMGDEVLLKLVETDLIVGQALGKTPPDLPKLPLQANFEEQVRKLKLPLDANSKEKNLDLREELDRNRSAFLFRLNILGIPWAKLTAGRSKGTFKEVWKMEWSPEMMISLIEMGIWGNSVEDAASKYLRHQADDTHLIGALSGMIQQAIPAGLFGAIEYLLGKINEAATVSADILELMEALVPLAGISRYGNVRQSDLESINALSEGLLIRICIGLPAACYGLDDETAGKTFNLMRQVNDAVRLLDNETLVDTWYQTLWNIAHKNGIPPVIAGCTCRLLLDAQMMDREETARRLSYELSSGNESVYAAAWVEGFLKSSGMILLYDDVLWNILHHWLGELPADTFTGLLPILRRTFAKFPAGERKQLGEKARRGTIQLNKENDQAVFADFDPELGALALTAAANILGIS